MKGMPIPIPIDSDSLVNRRNRSCFLMSHNAVSAQREEKNAFKSLGTGNRIATWLTYMSDVDYGGATVFTQMGVTLRPKRGAAAFWYNLFRNGEGDEMTRHAACPVLAGTKWG